MPFPRRVPVSEFPERWAGLLRAVREAFSAELGDYGSPRIGAAVIVRDPEQRWLASVFWARNLARNGETNLVEIAVSPSSSFAMGRIRSDEIAKWVRRESEEFPASVHHVGDRNSAWPTVGFRTEEAALGFLRRVGEARTGSVRANQTYPVPLSPYTLAPRREDGMEASEPLVQRPTAEDRLLRLLAAVGDHDPTDRRVRRVGQELLRRLLLRRRNHACEVTGMRLKQLLRCSHIKPWARASAVERIDPENCLLLAAQWDAAFDQGLISFDDGGRVLVGAALRANPSCSRLLLAGHERMEKRPSSPVARFLAWHREHIFRG
jgi:hypothetical protein